MAVILALLDAMVVFAVASAVLLWTQAPPGQGSAPAVATAHALAIVLCTVAAFYYYDLYDLRRLRRFRQTAPRLPRVAAVGALLLLAGHAPFGWGAIGPRRLLASGAAALVFAFVVREAAYRLMETRRRLQRVLIIGGGALAQELIAEIQARPDLRHRVMGFLDDRAGTPLPGCPRLGSLRDVTRVIADIRPHRVIVALASRRGSMPLKPLLDLRLKGIAVEDGAQVYEKLTGKIAIEALTPSSLIFSNDFRSFRLDLTLARALTLPLAAAGLVLAAPLLLLIALVIKLDSAGPVFFIQERVGRAGKLFKLIKFRTMRPADKATSEWVRDNDDRLTRVGRYLRRFRLDELPQLLNTVKGDMNLVGPRPHPVSNLDLLVMVMRNTPDCGETIPYYALRSLVRPGLTGWAQVRYQYANDLDEEIEKMRYDMYYIKHMSAWLDLRILFETCKIVLRGRESASRERAGAVRGPDATAGRRSADLRRASGDGLAAAAGETVERVAPPIKPVPAPPPLALRPPAPGA